MWSPLHRLSLDTVPILLGVDILGLDILGQDEEEGTANSQVVRFGMMPSLVPMTKFSDGHLSSYCKGA